MTPSELPTGTVTFLVSDIEGSTRLYQRLGDAYEAVLDTHRDILRGAFAANGGAEFACPGDGFLVAFASTGAAIRAAVDAQRALAQQQWPDGVEVRVRMGLHAGDARLTATGGTYTGFALHEAARIGGAGHGSQIVASETVVRELHGQLPDGVTASDLGEQTLKDLEGARRLYQLSVEGLPDSFPPLRTVPRTALPESTGPIFGRAADVDTTVQLLGSGARLVTLIGPGGVGKTTLALEAARATAKAGTDSWLVELAPLNAGADTNAVAVAVGRGGGIEVADLDALIAVLSSRAALLVLDNCEHVITAAATVAAALTQSTSVSVIATSREPLGITGERRHQVQPLSGEDAAALFVNRARDVRPSFSGDGASAAIDNICRRLDGLPLAIELAARRVRSLSPAEIDARLDARFRLLTGGDRSADSRQQTLEGAIDWSHELLNEDERVVFRRLAVFSGGFTIAAAEQVCGFEPVDEFDVADIVTALADRSLVSVDERGDATRFAMLETIRAYATARLADAGEADVARSRHLAWVAQASWAVMQSIRDGGAIPLALVADEVANVRSAVAWSLDGGDPEAGLRVVAAAGIFGMELGGDIYYSVPGWTDALLDAGAAADDPSLRAQAMLGAANAAGGSRQTAKLRVLAESAMALTRQHNLDGAIEAQALAMLGFVEQFAGHAEAAMALFQQAIEAARDAGTNGFLVFCHTFLAEAALALADFDTARAAAEEAVDVGRRVGEGAGTARALIRLANVAVAEGNPAEAEPLLVEAVGTAHAAHALNEAGIAEGSLAFLHASRGDAAAAEDHVRRAILLFENVGQWFGVAECRQGTARMAATVGDDDGADRELSGAVEALERTGAPTATPFFEIAKVAAAAGRTDAAARWLDAGIARARREGLADLVKDGEARLASLRSPASSDDG